MQHFSGVEAVAAQPDAVLGHERRAVGGHERLAELVVVGKIGFGTVVRGRARAVVVVRRHVGREIPGGGHGEQVWVLEEQVLASVAGLGEPDQPVLLGARGGQVVSTQGTSSLTMNDS